jgi:hypothetical protein
MVQTREQPTATPIEEARNFERIRSSSHIKHDRMQVFKDYMTTAAYADSLTFDKRLIKSVLITIIEKGGAQSIFYKVLGCINPSDWHEILGATALAASGHVAYTVSDAWAFIKLQAVNNSGVGTIDAFIAGQTP